MKQYIIFNILICAVLMCSCIDEYNAELPDKSTEILVVEGDIYSDSTTTIHLSYTVSLSNINTTDIPVVTNAKVAVKGSDGSVVNATGSKNGEYELTVGHLNPNEQYWLSITTPDGLNYESTPASPIDAPSFTLQYEQNYDKEHTDAPVDIYVSAERADKTIYLSWSYEEYYELKTPNMTNFIYIPKDDEIVPLESRIDHGFGMRINRSYFAVCSSNYKENRIEGLRLVSIPNDSPRLCRCYYIRAHQEAISKAEYEYEEARRKQSDEMGGLFTPQPSPLPTNIHCTNGEKSVIGYIGVRGHVSQTERYIRNFYDIHYVESRKYKTVSPEDASKSGSLPADMYANGYQVLSYDPMNGTTWITAWAVDCREGGWGFVSFDAPDFWNPPTE